MLFIWINGILSSLDGYSVHNTDFLALVKVLLTYIWRWLAKCSSSSFYSACVDKGLKQINFFFQISAIYIFYLAKIKERGRSFLNGARKGDTGWDYPRYHVVFMRLRKILLLWNLNNPTSSFAVLEPVTIKCCVDNRQILWIDSRRWGRSPLVTKGKT